MEVVIVAQQRRDVVLMVCQTNLWTRLLKEYHHTVVVEVETEVREDAEVVVEEDEEEEEVTGD